ncbi:MAG: ATP-grasp domain-containing protein [Desulfobacteria bacterium]
MKRNITRILLLESEDLYTVKRIVEAGEKAGIQVDSIDIFDITFVSENRKIGIYYGSLDLVSHYDAIIIRTFHPYISESLTIARLFHDAGKVVVDESLAEEGYAVSKMHDYIILAKCGISVPLTWQFFDPNCVEKQAEELGYPCILKGIHGSQGTHVHMVNNKEKLRKKMWQYRCGELLLQEYLPADEDYRVMVVGYKVITTMVSRKPKSGEFRTNFEFDEIVTPRSIEHFSELREVVEKSARILKREFAGVDIRYRGKTPLVLEVNRRPGFKGFEEKTGVDVAGEFIRYVYNKCCE